MALLVNILSSSNYSDYFKGILQIDLSESVDSAVIDDVVTEYQEQIFKDLFGEALYNYLKDNESESVYTTLRDGETITDENGYKYEWKGLKSMLAPFIYFYYKRKEESFDSPMGEKKSETQNATRALSNLRKKLTEAWNKGADLYRDAIDYIDYKNEQSTDYYPEFLPNYQNYYDYLTIM